MAIIINDVNDLQDINLDMIADYELGNHIEAVGVGFTMLDGAAFTGSLDGKGFEIRDLTITLNGAATQRGALFRTNQGTIKNLKLVDCVISVTSTGLNAIGASLVDYNDATGVIENCSATGTATFVGVAGASSAAGLVRINDGSIDDSYSEVIISVNAPTARAAGFAEQNIGPISNCYARGNATAIGAASYASGFIDHNFPVGVISYAYSTGIPTAGTIAGFCRINDETITACFWDTETSGTAVSDGGTGKTTAQMKLISTYSGWNIIIHSTDLNNGYPYLGWQDNQGITWLIYLDDSPRSILAIQDKVTLESIRNIEMSARGRFYVNKEGDAVYKSRYARNA